MGNLKDEDTIRSMIGYLHETHKMLKLIDKYKSNEKNKLEEITLAEFLDEYNSMSSLSNPSKMNFYNQFLLLSSLWAFLVVPKEAFYEKLPDDKKIKDMNKLWGLNKIVNNDIGFKEFITKLRHAIAHGNIEFNEELEFKFINRNRKNEIDFEVTFDSEDVQQFILAFAHYVLTFDIDLNMINNI